MNKEEMIKYYKKTEIEWEHLTPKEKAKKIKAHIHALLEYENNDEEKIQDLQRELIVLEELDSEEIESHLDMINKVIMENCMKDIEKNYK